MASTTMKRIASELGVSITTVSKVLNNQPDIGEATRKRVLAKVAELGYRRNAVARSLTLRRTHTLGVVIPDLMHSFFVEIVTAVEALISSRGYGLLVANLAEDPAKERVHLEMLLERQVDGVILASSTGTSNSDLLRRIGTLGKGLVFIDRDDHPKIKCHRVLTDDVEVGRLATEHVIGLGHKAIAHISAPGLVHAMRREEGYREAMAAHGLKVQSHWIAPGGFLQDQGYEAMQRLLKTAPEVTAVFAVNDPAAIGALKACWEAGVRVPEDITIVGAGDIAHGDMLRVPLTTVAWSKAEMGQVAAALLLDLIEGKKRNRTITVAPELIVRRSCGAGLK